MRFSRHAKVNGFHADPRSLAARSIASAASLSPLAAGHASPPFSFGDVPLPAGELS